MHLGEQLGLAVDRRAVARAHEVRRLSFLIAEPLGDRPFRVTHG